MKSRNVNCRTTIPALFMALAFSCLSSVTAQTGGREAAGGTQGSAIVGTWHVQVFFDPEHTQLLFESYKQWHSDGLEFESANLGPGVLCVGTWKAIGRTSAQLYHVGWTYGSPAGTTRFVWTERETVSSDGNSYDGAGQITYYDENGNQVGDPLPTYPHATRLPPQ
jgi:hypothetical protein